MKHLEQLENKKIFYVYLYNGTKIETMTIHFIYFISFLLAVSAPAAMRKPCVQPRAPTRRE